MRDSAGGGAEGGGEQGWDPFVGGQRTVTRPIADFCQQFVKREYRIGTHVFPGQPSMIDS